MSAAPGIAVVVPSHDRPLRLRWLLNALAEQTLERERFEVVVAHDSSGDETEELLRTHPLAEAGVLRHLKLDPTPWSAARLRNAAWREARAPVIAFTDDDCRPPRDWVERALEAAERHPGAIVQGKTEVDPHERVEGMGPHVHGQNIVPPTPFAETCNIVYPRELLERLGGFVDDPPVSTGEDTDLALRARKEAGVEVVGAPEMLTFHTSESASLPRRLPTLWRWQDIPWIIKRHPELRRHFFVHFFWKRTHVWLPLAAFAALRSRRSPVWLVLALPWLVHAIPKHGNDPRGRFRELSEVPGRFLYDATEMAALLHGSVKHRTLVL